VTPNNDFVQVAIDGSGKKIHNHQLYVLDSTGTPIPVYQQVVVLADDKGNIVDSNLQPVLQELLELTRQSKELLEVIAGQEGDPEPGSRSPVTTLTAQTGLQMTAEGMQPIRAASDKFGRQLVIPHALRDLIGTQTTTISASTTETTIVPAGVGFNDILAIIISNTSAGTNTRIDIRDTTAGTVLFSLQSIGGAAPVGVALPAPIPQTNRNANWTAQCATSTTDVRMYVVYVKNR
jgi:hypothetical protein